MNIEKAKKILLNAKADWDERREKYYPVLEAGLFFLELTKDILTYEKTYDIIDNKKETVYFIGDEIKDINGNVSVGCWYGPNPSVDAMLAVDGDSESSIIFKGTEDGNFPMYRWSGKRWRKIG